jgi:hypothetical protein
MYAAKFPENIETRLAPRPGSPSRAAGPEFAR